MRLIKNLIHALCLFLSCFSFFHLHKVEPITNFFFFTVIHLVWSGCGGPTTEITFFLTFLLLTCLLMLLQLLLYRRAKIYNFFFLCAPQKNFFYSFIFFTMFYLTKHTKKALNFTSTYRFYFIFLNIFFLLLFSLKIFSSFFWILFTDFQLNILYMYVCIFLQCEKIKTEKTAHWGTTEIKQILMDERWKLTEKICEKPTEK